MDKALQLLSQYGYVVLFVFTLAEQIGLPIPALPVLLAVGVLAGMGRISLPLAVLVAVLGAVTSDVLWYGLGRLRGRSVLNLVCRVSLEPDACVRRAQDGFSQHGTRILLFAKFIPGLSTVAPPLVGMLRLHFFRFLFWDTAGAVLWAGSWIGAGYLFRAQLEDLAVFATRLGVIAIVLLTGALVLYVLSRYIRRRKFLHRHRISRIAPNELMQKLASAEDVMVADLRHALDLGIEPVKIPGALHVLPEDLARRHQEMPRDRDIVLYCSCPNEVTSARMALELRRLGISRVRPLAGGFEAWRSAGFPVEPLAAPSARGTGFGLTGQSGDRR